MTQCGRFRENGRRLTAKRQTCNEQFAEGMTIGDRRADASITAAASPTPVASAIVLSTLASLVSIPAILLWVT
jgi:hypothetical protein